MATRRLLAIVTFLSLQTIALAAFTNPPPSDSTIQNPMYKLGEQIKITWETDADFTDLTMWQTGTGKRYNLQSNSKSKEYIWIASYQGIDPADGNSFSFWLFKTGDTGALFASHTFNITDPSSATTSAPTGTRTSKPKPKTKTSDDATETTANGAASASATDDPSPGLSTGATAGVAVGAVAGAFLMAGAGFMLWRRRRANKAGPAVMSTEDGQKYGYAPVEAPNDNVARQGPWEMGGSPTHFTHELPADNSMVVQHRT
ncbi:crumbs 3 [Fusarium beomiforme]|uniref:Crumbs 3 n=1 Tax=Fusarium beomiforme TaxID=44412 RepID=A0A9P5DTS0_9HYPO|nr:crumbs 3 [Fusarium beomiforme]